MCKDKQGSGEWDKQDFDAASSHHSQFALKYLWLDLKINTDYYGNKRNIANPSPGLFEIKNSGKQRIKLM